MIQSIETLNNIHTIRIHTRLPVVIPERIGHELIDWIQQSSRQMVFVLHINHPNEIDEHVITAMEMLKDAGVTLLNQSVLLKEVNDSAEVLTELSRRLFSAGVLPYYLHLLDPVSGAAHFEVDEEQAKKLMKELCGKLPGYLVPRLVREVPGKDAKQLLYST
jgi:KamA family protein